LVICLISGGGSALMPAPVDGVSLDDKQAVTQMLLDSGADIREINAVRKHISKIKGGQLAAHFFPAKVVSIIISDVVNNRLDTIASGPTVPDDTSFKDAYDVLVKFSLIEKVPASIKAHILAGRENRAVETPKDLVNAFNYIIADSTMSLGAMAHRAKTLGYKPLIFSTEISGDPASAAMKIGDDIARGEYQDYDILLGAGETTPALPAKHGQGGRNQHFCAVSMLALSKFDSNWAMSAIASDGVDFLKKTAGALVDRQSLQKSLDKKIDANKYLADFDSYSLLKKIDNCLIETGETGTNVGDLFVYILK
jgi:glycerate-2-kinase